MTNLNPLRNEIIGHIEASGELACWIVPYLYHAAYQTVKNMERDGTLVIEVGKRGEPVYVFAPATAPSAAPAAPVASDTTDWCAFPLTEQADVDYTAMIDSGYAGKVHRHGSVRAWHFADGISEYEPPAPARAADDAAKAALRGHTFKKPKAAKLSKRQRQYLELAVKEGGEVHHRSALYVASGRGNAQVMIGLVKRGLMIDTAQGWAITEAGKAALS